MKRLLICSLLMVLFLLPVNANSPSQTKQQTVTKTVTVALPPLNMTLLSASISGCSQTANINVTWTGSGYYAVSPSSFFLISKARNVAYGNTTNVASPNNIVSAWYAFKNIPITLNVSFQFCASISTESLVYNDGVFLFVLH